MNRPGFLSHAIPQVTNKVHQNNSFFLQALEQMASSYSYQWYRSTIVSIGPKIDLAHEFGCSPKNIPSRSFLRMPFKTTKKGKKK